MNKRTRAIDEETYKLIISTIQKDFEYQGVIHKPNERIATVLQLEYNLGLRIGDILNLTMDNFMKDIIQTINQRLSVWQSVSAC